MAEELEQEKKELEKRLKETQADSEDLGDISLSVNAQRAFQLDDTPKLRPLTKPD